MNGNQDHRDCKNEQLLRRTERPICFKRNPAEMAMTPEKEVIKFKRGNNCSPFRLVCAILQMSIQRNHKKSAGEADLNQGNQTRLNCRESVNRFPPIPEPFQFRRWEQRGVESGFYSENETSKLPIIKPTPTAIIIFPVAVRRPSRVASGCMTRAKATKPRPRKLATNQYQVMKECGGAENLRSANRSFKFTKCRNQMAGSESLIGMGWSLSG